MIDASMALAWVFERQLPSDAERASRLLAACGEQAWWVPGLWHLEVANALLVAERRGVIAPDASELFLARLSNLPIYTDGDAVQERRPRVMALGRAHGLSSYDATYLDLAHRLGATLASFDRRLNLAAADLGVSIAD
ncbi:type II toxin-antitoxin system VapC family toxin [Vulcanococcus limneticus]|uniref:type II toxin-antitoxin system VapC family toxin n=1 Tax=Vulcanococcus limneticus TaxID=2170428 RepID=UPI0020CF2B18|nr:type II toxin-antitoxin system VapC family toxin [Vulcanococcus limneticus]